MEWLDESIHNLTDKASVIRMFGKYQSAIGKETFILPEKLYAYRKQYSGYVFTDDEMNALFKAADAIENTKSEPFIKNIVPVAFRLIYTCGLRPNEGRKLKRENINFKTGEILITETKGKKERVVVMSDDMLKLCKKYDSYYAVFSKGSEYFFPSWNGETFTAGQFQRFFNDCWRRSNPDVDASKLPYVRVYDLRHRFASAALNKWLDEGKNLNVMLPYLRMYMGHSSLNETAYYIHLLPENLVKSAGVNWEAFNEIMPEVTLWQE